MWNFELLVTQIILKTSFSFTIEIHISISINIFHMFLMSKDISTPTHLHLCCLSQSPWPSLSSQKPKKPKRKSSLTLSFHDHLCNVKRSYPIESSSTSHQNQHKSAQHLSKETFDQRFHLQLLVTNTVLLGSHPECHYCTG